MKADRNAWTRRLALGLIVCAVIGTEVSYHFTLETRFEALEDKLAQQSTALQALQQSLDTTESSKNETLSGLNKQLADLESSFGPLGKSSQAQADAVDQLRREFASLQQAQSGQQDAQKKLADGIDGLEAAVKKARSDAASGAAKPPPTIVTPAPSPLSVMPPPSFKAANVPSTTINAAASAPDLTTNTASDLMASPGAISHTADRTSAELIASEALPAPAAPRAQAVLDLRPDEVGSASVAPRALPIASTLKR